MFEKWDVIVVGSGIGGLTAAAHLVRAGLHVLVLERNPHPGGTAYVYHRRGFDFPMGPSVLASQDSFEILSRISESGMLLDFHGSITGLELLAWTSLSPCLFQRW